MICAKDIMKKKIVTIRENTKAFQVGEILSQKKLNAICIVDRERRLKGIVTEKDILNAMAKGGFTRKRASDIMTTHIVSVKRDTDIDDITKIFSRKSFMCLPVVSKKKVVGMVHRSQVLYRLMDNYY